MPNHSSKPKRPRDANQLAHFFADQATGQTPAEPAPQMQVPPAEPEPAPDPIREAPRALGKRDGLKGGPARAKKLSAERRSEICRKAAKTRWDSSKS
jgi:hypothetical protein